MIKHLNFLISSFTFGWEITVKKLGFGTYNTMGHFMVHTYYYYFMYSIPAKSYKNKVILHNLFKYKAGNWKDSPTFIFHLSPNSSTYRGELKYLASQVVSRLRRTKNLQNDYFIFLTDEDVQIFSNILLFSRMCIILPSHMYQIITWRHPF